LTAIGAWSAPGQTEMSVFVILVTHPKSYIETTDRCDFGGKPSSGGEDGCYRENFRNFVALAEPDPKITFFCILGYPSTVLCTAYRKVFFTPNQWYPWKAETLKVCLLLVWRVCDWAFGRHRSLKGAEKWSHDHHEY